MKLADRVNRLRANWSLLGVSLWVLAASIGVVTCSALMGTIPLDLSTAVGWVLNVWISGHFTIMALFIGGSALWILDRALAVVECLDSHTTASVKQ